jgi:hypothetical protein
LRHSFQFALLNPAFFRPGSIAADCHDRIAAGRLAIYAQVGSPLNSRQGQLGVITTPLLVGTARRAFRAAYQRRNVGRDWCVGRDLFRPLLRGRGHRSAMSLPCRLNHGDPPDSNRPNRAEYFRG